MFDLFSQRILLLSLITLGAIVMAIVYALYRKICAMDRTVAFEALPLSKSSSFVERRSSHRIRSRSVLGLKIESGNGISGTATLHDMSTTGACFESPVLLFPKQKIQTRMQSPNDGSILELKAQVIWVKPGDAYHLYGVQFLPI